MTAEKAVTGQNTFCPVRHAPEVRRVLGGEEFGVARYGRGYAHLRGRNGYSFPHIEFALRYLPIAHDGPRHAELRDLASRYFQSKNEVMKACRLRLAAEAAAVLARGGRIDLLAEIVDPCVAGMVFDLSGVRPHISPSLIFDPATSLRKRRELDDDLGRLIGEMRAEDPEGGDDVTGIRLIFAILANDASRGMIASNLVTLLSTNIGRRLGEIDWPLQPRETGIRFIDRYTLEPAEIEGQAWPEGTLLRSELAGLTQDGDTASLFGIGRHLCLGRGFFWAFWRDLTQALKALNMRVVSVDAGPVSNRVFAIPDHAFVEVER